jgi:hypothetical protein
MTGHRGAVVHGLDPALLVETMQAWRWAPA